MSFNVHIYWNKNSETIISIDSGKSNYCISVKELFEYLRNKSKVSLNEKNINVSNQESSHKKGTIQSFVDDLIPKDTIDEEDENDELLSIDDTQLINLINRLLPKAKEEGIEEYYLKNNIHHERAFNMRGLIYDGRIVNERNRKTIRNLCKKCYEFLEMKKHIPSSIPKNTNTVFIESITQNKNINESHKNGPQPRPNNQNIIQKKENETQEETIKSTQEDKSGYIYVIREREFVNMNQNIFKIGRTENFLRRFSQYPKNSEIVFVNKVNDQCKIETDLIRKLKQKFKQRKDIGNEYFEAEKNSLLDIVKQITKD